MAVTTDPFVQADLSASIPAIWSDIMLEANFPEFVLQSFATDLSMYMDAGGRVCHVPNIYTNLFTVSTQSTQGAEINTQGPAQVDTTLTVDTHKYIAWIIGDADMVQLASKYALNEKYAIEAKKLLLQALEDSLFGLYTGLTTTAVGSAAAAIDDLSVRQAINTLAGTDFDLTETAFFIHPTVFYNQLIGLSKIAPNYSSGLGVIATGKLGDGSMTPNYKGMVYGQPVYISSRVPVATNVSKNLFLHKSAFGFAVQTKVGNTVRVQMENQLRNLGMLAVCDIAYGVGVLRSTAGVLINALNTQTVA